MWVNGIGKSMGYGQRGKRFVGILGLRLKIGGEDINLK